jgi:hypothetical protein
MLVIVSPSIQKNRPARFFTRELRYYRFTLVGVDPDDPSLDGSTCQQVYAVTERACRFECFFERGAAFQVLEFGFAFFSEFNSVSHCFSRLLKNKELFLLIDANCGSGKTKNSRCLGASRPAGVAAVKSFDLGTAAKLADPDNCGGHLKPPPPGYRPRAVRSSTER